MKTTSEGFRKEFFFLSNFFPAPLQVTFQDEVFTFATGEHAFQGMKVASFRDASQVLPALRVLEASPSPSKAKYWGRSVAIDVKHWDGMSLACMRRVIELKFTQHPELLELLLATRDIKLIEFNSWHDRHWGVDESTGEGKNLLGKLLMEYRSSHL